MVSHDAYFAAQVGFTRRWEVRDGLVIEDENEDKVEDQVEPSDRPTDATDQPSDRPK